MPGQIFAQQSVLLCPQASESLNQRWEWAVKETKQRSYRDGYWIGYNINKWMGENSFTGTYNWPPRDDEPSLKELLFGIRVEDLTPDISEQEILRQTAETALERSRDKHKPEKKVLKEVALLFRFTGDQRRTDRIEKLKTSNLSLHVDLKDLPILWLGEAKDPESVALLDNMVRSEENADQKEKFITAIGIHGDPDAVIPPLREILFSKEDDEIREKAAFWLGQQDDKRVLTILMKTAKTDVSSEVREKSVFAISQVDLPEAVDRLVELAERADDRGVQEKAIFWLGQTKDPKALKILVGIARSDPSPELREKAVFGLYQIDNEKGIEALIELAYKSRHMAVREKSIFWLGQRASKKAVKVLEDVSFNDADSEIQEKAVFALSQLPHAEGVPKLIEISKTHPNPSVRKKAIFWLGQSEDERALDYLVELVRKN